MKELKQTVKPNVPGRKLQKTINDAQAMLLQFLWRKHGGPSVVSRLCGVGIQHPNNWRMRGKVPLKQCRRVAQALDESIWALNYIDLGRLYLKKDRPTWTEVVVGCDLDKTDTKHILSMKPPIIN